MHTSRRIIEVARAEALFTSHHATGSQLARAEVAARICAAVRAFGGIRGCAAEVAYAYGEWPEIAAARMRWARMIISSEYGPPSRANATTRLRHLRQAVHKQTDGAPVQRRRITTSQDAQRPIPGT